MEEIWYVCLCSLILIVVPFWCIKEYMMKQKLSRTLKFCKSNDTKMDKIISKCSTYYKL